MTTVPDPAQPIGCTCSRSNAELSPVSQGPEDWLTPDELVTLLHGALSLGTLRNYRSARIGPAYVRVGRAIFYPRAEVDAWVAAQVRESEARWRDRY
jgi:hypothetical protein